MRFVFWFIDSLTSKAFKECLNLSAKRTIIYFNYLYKFSSHFIVTSKSSLLAFTSPMWSRAIYSALPFKRDNTWLVTPDVFDSLAFFYFVWTILPSVDSSNAEFLRFATAFFNSKIIFYESYLYILSNSSA